MQGERWRMILDTWVYDFNLIVYNNGQILSFIDKINKIRIIIKL